MKPWIKWTLVVVVTVVILLAAAIVLGLQMGETKKTRKLDIAVKPVPYTTEPQALARGKYLFESRGCVDCHGANGVGRDFVNTPDVQLRGANITAAGATASYKPEDWVRIIRHGVKPNGQPALIMPSEDYNRFTDQDLASIVAYVRSLPPVQGGGAVIKLPLPARVLYG
ncbi:MAG: cytochrome c, partial [Ramlibacter sp.]